MLQNLKLTDFKRHKSLEADFTDGLNLVIGHNYKGKSSLLQGVLYVLWGYSAVPGGKAVAVNDEAKNAGGELSWLMGGHRYHLVRKGANATLSRDGDEIAKGATPVAAELESLFGMDRARFLQLKHSAQKNTEALLTLGAAKLHQIIEEISGADVVSKVIEACKTVETECKGGLEALPDKDAKALAKAASQLQQDLIDRHAKVENAKAHREHLRASLNEFRGTLAEVRANNAEAEQAEAQAKVLKERLAEWEQVLNIAAELIGAKQGAAAKLDELTEEVARLQQQKYEIGTRAEQHEKVTKAVEGLKKRAVKYRADLEAAEAAAEACEVPEDIDGLQEKVSEAAAKVGELTAKFTQMKTSLENSTCPACQRPLDEHTDVEEMRLEFAELTEATNTARGEHSKLTAQVRAAAQAAEKRNEAVAAVSQARSTFEANEADLTEAMEELETLNPPSEAEINGLAQRLGAASTEQSAAAMAAGELSGAMQSLKQAEGQIADAREQLTALPELKPIESTEKLEAEVARLEGEVAKSDTFITSAEEGYRIDYGRWTEASAEAKAAAESEEKRKQLASRMGTAGQLKKFLSGNRDRYLTSVWEGVMTTASNFASACTDGYISQVTRTADGAFKYIEGEVERPVDAASGAQRSIMGLGVQLALDSMLPCPFQTLLLDEPTADADEQHSLAISAMLSAAGKQLVMVSHRALDGAVAENVIEVA